ncbi:glycerol transporter [Flavimobilis marinus]|uniref:Glycerol uptake facilitator protein n=1 Tax=Flavimobilis marinus TaxID=285351 RepID=A0A1I2CPD0_9MICO|nr:MIP/aquaporin family protein [Flavimobilis marinus]GHG47215.1 glycerol transporter [Flavimobilis marinus]SFE70171.1 glycerol uptake facilitator protein [Flavimobilis marinus]
MDVTIGQVFISEVVGTALLILLGAGVVANVILPKTKGFNGGWIVITFGWGLAVFAGVWAAWRSGAHLNPAVTVGIIANGQDQYVEGVDVNLVNTLVYFAGEMIGAMLGALLAYLAYKKHFDLDADPGTKLAVFATAPEVRSPLWNVLTEVLGTFVLVFVILNFANTPTQLGPLAVALVVVGIGLSLGGPTGYAINPARDLGPRIVHALLPIKGKGSSDWSYAWVPVVGPLVGGALAGLLALALA